jgi:hypothetical protein
VGDYAFYGRGNYNDTAAPTIPAGAAAKTSAGSAASTTASTSTSAASAGSAGQSNQGKGLGGRGGKELGALAGLSKLAGKASWPHTFGAMVGSQGDPTAAARHYQVGKKKKQNTGVGVSPATCSRRARLMLLGSSEGGK